MSSSYVEYRGHGFWSFDPYLEHLLALLAEAGQKIPNQAWLAEACSHWRAQSSGSFAGWIHPMLDEYVTSDERRSILGSILETAISGSGVTTEVKKTAELLRLLIEEQLETDQTSPLDYMVQGPKP